MVEHLSCKQKVMGSIPIVASHIFGKILKGISSHINTLVKTSHSLKSKRGLKREERRNKKKGEGGLA